MNQPDPPISVEKAEENGWRESSDPLTFSEVNNKIYLEITKEPTPTEDQSRYFVYKTEETFEEIPGSGEFVTETTRHYFKIGELYEAEIGISSSFPASDDTTIIIEIGEIEFETKKVTQYLMSDAWPINVLKWETRSRENDEDSDSDSDSSDQDNYSDSDDSDQENSDNECDS